MDPRPDIHLGHEMTPTTHTGPIPVVSPERGRRGAERLPAHHRGRGRRARARLRAARADGALSEAWCAAAVGLRLLADHAAGMSSPADAM
jgi:hypothetical protein